MILYGESKDHVQTTRLSRLISALTISMWLEDIYSHGIAQINLYLTLNTLDKILADDTFVIVFLFSPEKRHWNLLQIVFLGDNLHKMSKPFYGENQKNTTNCRLLNLPNER